MTIECVGVGALGIGAAALALIGLASCGSDPRPGSLNADDGANSTGGSRATLGAGGSSTGGGAGAPGDATSTQGSGAVGGAGATTSSNGGAAGEAAASGGTGGSEAICGDGVVEGEESCDADDLQGSTCSDLGFESGDLGCSGNCTFDAGGCSGIERCFDGRDNDGDGRADCVDLDCADHCSDACDQPPELESGALTESDTTARPSLLQASCSAGNGPEIVYVVEAELTGKLEATVESEGPLTVSLRTDCGEVSSELGCRIVQGQTTVSADVVMGQSVFVLVDGYEAGGAADFRLTVASRPANVCGDGFTDEEEACDDENHENEDGCNALCEVESSESEPNDSSDTAATIVSPTYASIDPAGDVDYYLLTISDGPRQVIINTYNVSVGWCSELLMDPYLELIALSDASVVASDDDSGDGFCAKIVATLPNGDYHIVVRESPDAGDGVRATFPYQLGISLQ